MSFERFEQQGLRRWSEHCCCDLALLRRDARFAGQQSADDESQSNRNP